MKEENKRKINKLIIPFTRRTLSFLTATTILASSTVGCKEDNKDDSEVIDTSSLISSTTDDEIISSDIDISDDNSFEFIINEESLNNNNNNIQSNDNQINNNNTVDSNNKNSASTNNNNVNSSNSNNNNQNNIINNSQNNSSNINKPIVSVPSGTSSVTPSIPTKPVMPNTLTTQNINNIEVFKYFAEEFRYSSSSGAISLTFEHKYNGETYETDGVKEFQLALFLLNYNYVNIDLFKSLFGNCTIEELKRHVSFVEEIPHLASTYYIDYDFEKLCLDKDLGKFLSRFTEEHWIIMDKKINSNFNDMVSQYFVKKDQSCFYGKGNFWADYYIWALTGYSRFYIRDKNLMLEYEKNNGYSDYYNRANSIVEEKNVKLKTYVKE